MKPDSQKSVGRFRSLSVRIPVPGTVSYNKVRRPLPASSFSQVRDRIGPFV